MRIRPTEIEFLELGETLVAGLPVRSPKRPLGVLQDRNLESAWSGVLQEDVPGPLASIYTDHATENDSYYTQIVGYQCSSIDEVRRGHLVARIPAGRYARFVSLGEFPGVVAELWDQVRDAVGEGRISRAFTGDFERYPNAFRIDLYVSVRTVPGEASA
ncbi:putative transcriptional regulator YdeE [Rhodococcus sp. PvR044]|jgi:predicted transcriptional regulator YdeE|uniref:GyrI-like domain-containing protein n=1 Tax=unclassified Rhodococcus (in: high G+C Gram-positive bacteria) TaxID=192944 RepID=UPI000BCBEAF1|nr:MULTISPECIES: GyrI-like domain-containing protein [unclassified Rhodococcus (in: high G+C Gram-positive bacteria)]PTR42812.1 putative transcriptional regulator YdeE [Rhodococcus sp. OK611]SNX91831.1 Predicted transcriptional regulator YdeE, contains AraC-type DNA-binding domain [Rhodococcus sp. OK270]